MLVLGLGLGVSACGGAQPAPPAGAVVHTSSAPVAVAPEPAPRPFEGHWFFESLSQDNRRALLRRLDGEARATLQTRVVDVDTGASVAEVNFIELGKLPTATIGRKPNEVAELMGMLTAPAFGDDLSRAARIAEEFPFGSCGRLSVAPQGGAIAFNAGDWLYITDESGRVRRRLTNEAAYDPRFTPDGRFVIFRRATGTIDKVRAKYELFAAATDLSEAPRLLPGTAGTRDRFVLDAEGKNVVTIASQEPQIKTCVLSIAARSPFAVKKVVCLDGGEQFVESTLSPTGRYAAVTTQSTTKGTTTWRLRVVSTAEKRVVLDEPEEPGMIVRALSDEGLLVQSGGAGVMLTDVPSKIVRTVDRPVDLGHRGFFRSATDLVVVRGGTVAVVDLAAL